MQFAWQPRSGGEFMNKAQSFVLVASILFGACSGSRSTLEPETDSSTSESKTDSSAMPACGMKTKTCDPTNLGGATCASMGAGNGKLMCDPVTCAYDVSMCDTSASMGQGGLGA